MKLPAPTRLNLVRYALGAGVTTSAGLLLAWMLIGFEIPSVYVKTTPEQTEVATGQAAENRTSQENYKELWALLGIPALGVSAGGVGNIPPGPSGTVIVPTGNLTITGLVPTITTGAAGQEARFRAFPEAEGFGAHATWNADSTDACARPTGVHHRVTNLNDSGAGSFRDIIENQLTNGVLDVVTFTTGGTIVGAQVELKNGCLIVAGQTAPGGGIQLHNSAGGTVFRLHRNGSASDVVVRYVRFRSDKGTAGTTDVVDINGGNGIIFDHTSSQFGNDEVFTITGFQAGNNGSDIENVTLQRNIIAAGLRPHSTGGIYKRVEDGSTQTDSLSIHHVLYANNGHRNPRIVGIANAEVINIVTYNWKNFVGGMEGGSTNHPCNIDWVRNYYKQGPWTSGNEGDIIRQDDDVRFCHVFAEKSVADTFQADSTADQKNLFKFRFGGGPLPDSLFEVTRRTNARVPITEQHAVGARDNVLADVGANAKLDDVLCNGGFLANIDVLDSLIIFQATNGTGPSTNEENDDPADYGGIPTLASGTACLDTDLDGMPDAFEDQFAFLDKTDANDSFLDNDGDGYTNLEEYLNGTQP